MLSSTLRRRFVCVCVCVCVRVCVCVVPPHPGPPSRDGAALSVEIALRLERVDELEERFQRQAFLEIDFVISALARRPQAHLPSVETRIEAIAEISFALGHVISTAMSPA